MSDLAAALSQISEADQALLASGPTPLPLPIGRLAPTVAGTVTALSKADWWVPGLRERVGAVLRGVPVERLVDGMAGARPYKVAPPDGSPALRALSAVGLALANPERFAAVHLGIGSVGDGAFTEALNLAALAQANVIFVVAVDPLGEDAPVGPQTAASPEGLAAAYGIPHTVVDGTDAAAVNAAVRAALDATGPHLIAARLG